VLSAYAFLADMTGVSQTSVAVFAPTRGKAPIEFPARRRSRPARRETGVIGDRPFPDI
jgi:hypothetical protein